MSIKILPTDNEEPLGATNQESLAENEYRVISWVKLGDMEIENTQNRTKQVIHFPKFEHQDVVYSKKELKQLYLLNHTARRVRNYLSFVFYDQIPMYYQMRGKNLFVTTLFQADFPFRVVNYDKTTQELTDALFIAKYALAKKLLQNIKIDTFDDKVINLYGSLFWTEDPIDQFMYAWRIIELISSQVVDELPTEYFGEFGKLVQRDGLESVLSKMSITRKIRIALTKVAPHIKLDDLRKSYKIRNNIFHGALPSAMLEDSIETMKWVVETAHEAVRIRYIL